MKLLITLLITIIIPLSAYMTTQKVCCPHKDIKVFVPTPWGLLDIEIEKDLLNKENEDKYYIDSKKYNKILEEEEIEKWKI